MAEQKWLDRAAVEQRLAELMETTDPDVAMAIYDRWRFLKRAVRELDRHITDAIR